jgi:hypothetical protein
MNQKHQDEALNETNTMILSDFANDALIESNLSSGCRWSWNRLKLQRGTDGATDLGSQNGSNIWNGLDKRILAIYALLGFKDILFFEINQFLERKMLKSFLEPENILKAPKILEKFLDMIWHQ